MERLAQLFIDLGMRIIGHKHYTKYDEYDVLALSIDDEEDECLIAALMTEGKNASVRLAAIAMAGEHAHWDRLVVVLTQPFELKAVRDAAFGRILSIEHTETRFVALTWAAEEAALLEHRKRAAEALGSKTNVIVGIQFGIDRDCVLRMFAMRARAERFRKLTTA